MAAKQNQLQSGNSRSSSESKPNRAELILAEDSIVDTIFIGYLIGYIGATLTTFSYVAQLTKSLKTKSTGDLSLIMYIMVIEGCTLWLVYGILVMNWVIIGANSVSLLIISSILYLIVKYNNQTVKAVVVVIIAMYFMVAMLFIKLGWILAVGLMATALTSTCNLPQVFKILKTKRTEDISLPFYVVLTIGIICWLTHGILLKDVPLITANIITMCTVGSVLTLKLLEKRNRIAKRRPS
ncbi:MAG: SemiSWEET transporter [Nanoarchaeota archaeon]